MVCAISILGPASARGAPGGSIPITATDLRLIRIQAELNAQHEARDRQADAFDAAVSRIEAINEAMVILIALAGLGASLVAIRRLGLPDGVQ